MGGARNLEYRQDPPAACDDMSWVTDAGDYNTVSKTLGPLAFESLGKRRRASESCHCLVNAILFLERLVSRSTSHEDRIDLLLTDVRNSLETLEKFMECNICGGRAEQNTLLSMAVLHIGFICGRTAICYKAMNLGGLSGESSSQQRPGSENSIDISISTYRVNRRERLHVLKSLLTFQILELQKYIDIIKGRYRNQSNQGQAETLIEAENHVNLAQVTINSPF